MNIIVKKALKQYANKNELIFERVKNQNGVYYSLRKKVTIKTGLLIKTDFETLENIFNYSLSDKVFYPFNFIDFFKFKNSLEYKNIGVDSE